jgi:hypothetical protein
MPVPEDRSKMRDEDRMLAERFIGERTEPKAESYTTSASEIMPMYGDSLTLQKAIEQAMRDGSHITVFGIAPRPMAMAIQFIMQDSVQAGTPFPWLEFNYVTPMRKAIYRARDGEYGGTIVRRWESAFDLIRRCVQHEQLAEPQEVEASQRQTIRIYETSALCLDAIMIVTHRDSGRRRAWISLASISRIEQEVFFLVDDDSRLFDLIAGATSAALELSSEVSSRQGVCDLLSETAIEEINAVRKDPGSLGADYLRLTGLRPYGTSPDDGPFCMPTVLVALRSVAAGEQVILLRRRTQLMDPDSVGRLSLISGRLLEEDIAAALGVPFEGHREASDSMDMMWKAAGGARPLGIHLDAFIRAAQREILVWCGLDIPSERLHFCGYQSIPTGEGDGQICHALFELVLSRKGEPDELKRVEAWSQGDLLRVPETILYSKTSNIRVNRLLTRLDWLEKVLFSRPVNALM